MPFVFWLDVALLLLSGILAFSLALTVACAGFQKTLNRFFVLYALGAGIWAISYLIVHLILWKDDQIPVLWLMEWWLRIYAFTGPALFGFTVRYVGRHRSLHDVLCLMGIIVMSVLSIPALDAHFLEGIRVIPNGTTIVDLTRVGMVTAIVPGFFFSASLFYLWRNRRQLTEPYIMLSVLVLVIGLLIAGPFQIPFPVFSLMNTLSLIFLGYTVLTIQLLNPLKERNIELGEEIQKRKEVERQLNESKMRLSQILDFLPDPTFGIDLDGKVIFWNRAIEKLTGVSSRDMVGKSDFEYSIPFHGERHPVLIDLLLQWDDDVAKQYDYVEDIDGILVSENRNPLFAPEGFHFWNAASRLFDVDGRVIGAIETIHDVSELKRSERALKESELRFRAFFDSNPEGVVIIDLEGNLSDANQTLLEMSGYSAEELFKLSYESFVHPDYLDELNLKIQRLKDGDEKQQMRGRLLVTKEGGSLDVDLRGWMIADQDGHPIGIGAFVRDVSREQALIEEKTALERQLQHAQKMEAIGTLAGGIAHDFNNILNAIIGYADLSLAKPPPNDETLQHYMTNILSAAVRASDLTRQIMKFSRQDSSDHRPISMLSLVQEVIDLIRSTFPASIEIEERISADDDLVIGDATQIHQVLLNLCTNAAHAMGDKRGRLTISMERRHLDQVKEFLTLECPPGEYLVVEVADTGTGISLDVKERIFEPYFSTKEMSEGTGLGLSVTYGIIKSHGGMIEVDSAVGRGTTFSVFLPIAAGEKPKPKGEGIESAAPGDGARVLLVDDEEFFLDVVRESLERMDFRVTCCHSGEQAIRAFYVDPGGYDVIITDQGMPDMSGLQLIEKIRVVNPDVPVILCTGYSEFVSPDSADQFNIDKCLMKPVAWQDLVAAIHDVLRHNQTEKNSSLDEPLQE